VADLAALVTPPYDVISPEAQARYYERHPHNIIRLELGRDKPGDDELDNKYTRAAATFADWRLHGIMRQDPASLYLYEQRFSVADSELVRLSLLARVRLEPWEAGVVLPHERTLSKPRADRLQLTRACAANFSPIMTLYDDPNEELSAVLSLTRSAQPTADFADEAGERHLLWPIQDDAFAATVAAFFHDRQLYIADGHHRYETALAYRDEVARLRKEPLPPDDPANFTLMALCAVEDPSLVVLPTHRILRDLDAARLAALDSALAAYFDLQPLDRSGSADAADVASAALHAATAGSATAFVLVRPDQMVLLRLHDRGREAMAHLTGDHAGASAAWRGLDVAILHELVLDRGLGVGAEAVRAGEHVTYTRDASAALAAVREGDAALAVLLAPTPPSAIRDVARAGDRMPQKSTYFYPKLITGLVVNPLW
jgi:uncharacterized protein (DUF1015 family)